MIQNEEMDPAAMIFQFALDNPDDLELEFLREDPGATEITHISMGRMNYVFRVRSRDQTRSIIIKHSREYARTVPWVEMTLRRQVIEYNALEKIGEISPGSVPRPYCIDTNHSIIAMEDLGHMELLGSQLRRGEVDEDALVKLGHLIYQIHRATDKELVSEDEWHSIVRRFKNDDLRSSIRGLQLDRSLNEQDASNDVTGELLNVYRNMLADTEVEATFHQLITWYNTDVDCLVQADCHENAIFVKEGHCAIFDLEFCFLGNRAAHLAIPLRDLILAYRSSHVTSKTDGFRSKLVSSLRGFLESYLEGYSTAYNNKAELLSRITAFVGAFLIRVAIRRAMREDWSLSIDDKIAILKCGMEAMKQHKTVTSLDSLMDFFILSTDSNRLIM